MIVSAWYIQSGVVLRGLAGLQIHSIDNNQKISYKDMKFLMIAANVTAFAYTCVTGDATILAITIAWLWSVYGKSIYKAWYKFTRI